ncbi:hypothetical protein FRC12_002834 [Ceratobasidium sp. 428]|nr:hypothetical protein FRC12_002834 [Ceratobasidium sp. 428]
MSQHGTSRGRRANNRGGGQRQNEHRNERQGERQDNGRNEEPDSDESEGDLAPGDDASVEEWKEAHMHLQLKYNERGKRLAEFSRSSGRPERNEGTNRSAQTGQQSQTHSDDDKYKEAGRRCALMQTLWVRRLIFGLDPSPDYSPEVRYHPKHPLMAIQGERQDILNAVPPRYQENLLKYSHFQSLMRKGAGEERHNLAQRVRGKTAGPIFGCGQEKITCGWESRMANSDFQKLLGFKADGETVQERYPALAPVLYKNSQVGRNSHLFRSDYIFKIFSISAFGEGSLQHGIDHKTGQPVIAEVLSLQSITPGAVAAAAVLVGVSSTLFIASSDSQRKTRWAISPDPEFTEIGAKTGVKWTEDFKRYKKLIFEGLRLEEEKFERVKKAGPFMKTIGEWNRQFFPHKDQNGQEGAQDSDAESDAPDVEDALAQIREFAENDAGGEE